MTPEETRELKLTKALADAAVNFIDNKTEEAEKDYLDALYSYEGMRSEAPAFP